MKNLFRNIKLAFSAQARNELINDAIAADAKLDRMQREHETVVRQHQYAEQRFEQDNKVQGSVTPDDLLDFSSEYARNAVANLGSWSALAKGFSAFVRNNKDPKAEQFSHEFHAWNSVAVKQMDEESVLTTVANLSQVKPATGNKDTDAIIARITKKTVAEVQADREAKAKIATAKREDAIINYTSLVWSCVFGDGQYSMEAQRVLDKLQQTLLWIASWDTTNPAAIAAELLLIERDIELVKGIANKPADETFTECSLTSDGMMKNNRGGHKSEFTFDPLKELSAQAHADKQSFENWQAEQHAA